MKARTINLTTALAISCLTAALFTHSEVQAAAGGIQDCTAGSSCVVGEFLYDDDSVALTGATCTLTSKYPDGSAHLTSQAMTGQSDGWYAYEFIAPTTTGLYRATVSCSASGDTTTIDRSFQVNSAVTTDTGSIASAVWSYSGRTVTSFGSLIADIWASATRTLTGVGLSSGQLATQEDVVSVRNKIDDLSEDSGDLTEIKKSTSETRLLIEQVANAPIIQNVLEESVPDLSGKIEDTKVTANQIYINNQYLTSRSASLGASWNSKNGKDLLSEVIEISDVLDEEVGQIMSLKDSWNWDEVDSIYGQIVSTKKIVEDLKVGLADYKKSPELYLHVKALVKNFVAIEKIIGVSTDTPSKKTLFTKIKTTESLALRLDEKSSQVDKVLGTYVKNKDTKTALLNAKDLKNQVIALNKVPGVVNALTRVNPSDPISIKNALLGLRGIINSNKKLLALGAGKTLVNTWLEIGSIIFKTIATNPSSLISQEVDVKYYLPAEIKEEDIIKTDAGLTVEYDSEKDQFFVAGTFTLAAGQTKTFSVETKDIWEYSQANLDSLRKQADDLFKPLEKTAYFAQAVSLNSDIHANLDKISDIQGVAITPEDKIRAYRESKIIKSSVDEKIAGMRDLVTQSSAAGNLFGFVGGAQSIAVWGLIIVIIAGFVFMTIYMKTITTKAKREISPETKKVLSHNGVQPAKLIMIMIISSALSAATTGFIVNKLVSKNYEAKLTVLGEKIETTPPPTTNEAVPIIEENYDSDLGLGGLYIVTVGETPTGFLRVRETPGGAIVSQVNPGDSLPYLDENDEWYEVELETGETGWISKEYSTKQ